MINKFYNFFGNNKKKKIENIYNKNIKIFEKLDIDVDKVKSIFKNLNLDINDRLLSWHYHLFAGFSQNLKKNSFLKILEIGTHDGKFSNFLSKVYLNAEIHTIDLPSDNVQFINTYHRDKLDYRKKFLEIRKMNLNASNIFFHEFNSKNLLNFFEKKSFDLIWVDGDHMNPQVTLDINNSLKLIKDDGIILVDDVVLNKKFKFRQGNQDSYKTLINLQNLNITKNFFISKRLDAKKEKFIGIIFLNY